MPTPSLRQYLELPIQVQHSWDAYPTVDQALIELEQGQFLNASILTDAVWTDDRVAACLQTRLNAVFGLPLEFRYPGQTDEQAKQPQTVPGAPSSPGNTSSPAGIAPITTPGTGEEPERPEVLELKQLILTKLQENWERILPSAALKEVFKFGLMVNAGVGELVWGWGADGLWYPTLKSWNSQFLYWRWDTRSYWLIHAGGQVELHPGNGRWVLFSPGGHNHGWLYGLIRSLGKLWIDRVFAARDWSRASEKYGLGVIKAKMPAWAQADDKSKFLGATQNLPNETLITLPQGKKDEGGFDLEMMTTDSAVNWQSFKERSHKLDTDIAVLTLGQNLTTEISGSGSGGSRAAARVHDNVRGDYLKSDDEVLSSMERTQILIPWVRFNWADEAQRLDVTLDEITPYVIRRVDPPEDRKEAALAIAAIADAVSKLALSTTEVDIRRLMDKHGIPIIEAKGDAERAPPSGVNERPRLPARIPSGDPRSGLPRPSPQKEPGLLEPPETTHQLTRTAGAGRGALKGQLLADDIADDARDAGKAAMADRKDALLELIQSASGYEEIRAGIKQLYLGLSPSELRDITEKAILAAELVGRHSVALDTRKEAR